MYPCPFLELLHREERLKKARLLLYDYLRDFYTKKRKFPNDILQSSYTKQKKTDLTII